MRDFEAYRASVDRLVETSAGASATWLLGAHIEMTDQAAEYTVLADFIVYPLD